MQNLLAVGNSISVPTLLESTILTVLSSNNLGRMGPGDGQFNKPHGVAFAPNGEPVGGGLLQSQGANL